MTFPCVLRAVEQIMVDCLILSWARCVVYGVTFSDEVQMVIKGDVSRAELGVDTGLILGSVSTSFRNLLDLP